MKNKAVQENFPIRIFISIKGVLSSNRNQGGMSGGLFGERKSGDAFGGLFSKPSAIDGESLVKEKQEKYVKAKKEAEKEAAAAQEESEETGETEDAMEVEEEPVVEEKVVKKPKKRAEDNLEDEYMKKLVESDEEEDESDEEEKENEKKKEVETESGDSKTADENLEAKIVDLKQKEFDNAEKTVFIGNVPTVVASSKRDTKDFKQFLNRELGAKEGESLIQSIRFRALHSNTNAPRKVAYINKEINMEASMVSYVVFKTKETSLRAIKLNGKMYKENHLRFDHLTHPSKKDNKMSVFVGNVAFEETEEKLWRYFNKAVGGREEVVDNVRIVRDSTTSFGKGFAIVQFNDTNCVEKALLLNNKRMNGRPLRVTRCKKMKRNNDTVRKKTAGMNEKQKTIIGRAKVLNKSDRATIGRLVLEGERAKTGGKVGIKKPRHKKRVTKRSKAFKEGK